MSKAGRKTIGQELQMKQRYAALSEQFFAVLETHLKSRKKSDQRWAAEQLSKAYVRMVPQALEGADGEPLSLTLIVRSSADVHTSNNTTAQYGGGAAGDSATPEAV